MRDFVVACAACFASMGVGFWLRDGLLEPKDYVMRFHSPPYDWDKEGL